MIRLGDGTEESHARMMEASHDFESLDMLNYSFRRILNMKLQHPAQAFCRRKLKDEWYYRVNKIFETATLPSISIGKKTDANFVRVKMEFIQNTLVFCWQKCRFFREAYPGATW